MQPLTAGQHAPPFTLPALDGSASVPDPAGRRLVVMFFQEAGTPTCTTQVLSLAQEAELLGELGAAALFISTDPLARLRDFAATLPAGVRLASDGDGAVAKRYGVYDESNRRAQRAAFVVEPQGTLGLALPWYNPLNSEQLAQIFAALGLEAGA
ncbi:MAG TPA: peroxiredoxin family protein [Dehalococcoidia bacterium]|jgi:peroxiredoxin Q/BCP